ncbi:MAG: hypothetical protein KDC52_18230 [Ignavibacteriae bacterium]|nr:hypothetical protein [Ignavibacteriota bacterium]
MKKIVIVWIACLLGANSFCQNKFENLDFLIGKWQGVETGVSGDGIGFRTYDYDMNEHYIIEKNQSTFAKTEKKPIGEVHRDFGVFSFNGNTSKIVYRSFNIEGFTNIFELDNDQSTETKFIFITREIENNPGNWKAKVTIEKISDNEFLESFDIAMDGENYVPFLKNHWYRTK